MIRKILFLLLLSIPMVGWSQTTTTVSGTITDPNGIPYKNGTYYISLVDSNGLDLSNTPINVGGAQITVPPVSGLLSSSGAFSVGLYANGTIFVPSGTGTGSKWKFYICSQPPSTSALTQLSVATSGLVGAQVCFNSSITISGSSQSVSTTLSNASTAQVLNLSSQSLNVPAYSGGGLTRIAQVVVVGSTTTNITFSSIPQTFTNLEIKCSGETDYSGGADNLSAQVNGDTGAHYSYSYVLGGNTVTTQAVTNGGTSWLIGGLTGATVMTTQQGEADINISGYSGTTFGKTFNSHTTRANGSASVPNTDNILLNGEWNSTAAITSVKLFPGLGTNFVAGTICTLYGL